MASQRLGVLGVVAVALLTTLLVRVFWLQVVTGSELDAEASAERIRVVHVQAPRGRILDRQGDDVLVDDRLRSFVSIDVDRVEAAAERDSAISLDDVVAQVVAAATQHGVPTTTAEIQQALDDATVDPLQPVPVVRDVPEALEVYLLERRHQLPGVDVGREAVRSYAYGSVGAHVLGYVGAINEEELAEHEDDPEADYALGDDIGKTGIEAAFEDDLRGTPGSRTYEVDASGEVVRLVEDVPPIRGHDVRLTIDVDLQAYVEQQLAETVRGSDAERGSVVVQDPQDGTILAMASNPPYSPAELAGGISADRYAELNAPDGGYPLNNWAIQGQYAAASTFKPFTAWAGMRAQLRGPDEPWADGGVYVAEGCAAEDESCSFQNDGRTAWGTVDLRRALAVSSDTYFYSLGDLFWLRRETLGDDAFQREVRQWGFGERTGVDLPSEIPGLVSTPASKAERHEQNPTAFPYGEWFTGDNINMAIGQGDLLVTPLQLTNAYSAIANGGTLRQPLIATEVLEPLDDGSLGVVRALEAEVIRELELPEEQRQPIVDGLVGVVSGGEGTAQEAFAGFDPAFVIAGKTGTAQVAAQEAGNALFVAFGPVSEFPGPRFTVTAILENTEEYGGGIAAPLVRSVFDVLADPALLPRTPTAEAVLLGDG